MARVKSAATEAIVAGGGTITHHHGVGVDHAPWLSAEIGDLGVGVLRAIKAELDPVGILNPGKLLPPSPGTPSRRAGRMQLAKRWTRPGAAADLHP